MIQKEAQKLKSFATHIFFTLFLVSFYFCSEVFAEDTSIKDLDLSILAYNNVSSG